MVIGGEPPMSAHQPTGFKWAMLTGQNLCLSRQRLAQFGLQLVVGRPEGRVRLDDTRGGSAENWLQVGHLSPASALGGTERGTQGGGVGDGQTEDRSAEDIGEDLGDGRVLGRTTGEEQLRGRRADPAAMIAEAERLAFDGGTRQGGLSRRYAEGDASGRTTWRDLGLFHRKDRGDGGGRSIDGGGEGRPVGMTAFAADRFAGERTVAHADEAHAAAHRITEGVAEAGGQFQLNTSVQSVTKIEGGYAIQLSNPHGPRAVTARNLVVACGGKPIPKMGATDFALRLAQQFGLPVTETYAGLVPFTFSGAQHEAFKSISGVTAPARLQTNGTAFDEAVLFTHRGLSGPAALQVSSYWSPGDVLTLGLLPEEELRRAVREAKETEGRKAPLTIFTRLLPARLVPVVLNDLALPERIADLTVAQLETLTERLPQWRLIPAGTEGYRTAEVMVGGVDTAALSSKTMMAKTQPGLYFIGECVDVTGWLGGYNFQWAWSSGWVAGQAIKAGL